ncbi:MAG: ExsB family transcriptional regulator, partial [Deltaproteobacteria bacterium]|nr:ExsB family transcriptional regulator [Deltaproteobacteria bacterium]
MDIQEITLQKLDSEKFIQEWAEKIQSKVGEGLAVNALSGGVDSSVVTLIGHKALDKRLKTYFIENGLMREGEPEHIVSLFKNMGVHVDLIDAKEQFFGALKGLTDPEEKREAITHSFYKEVFGRLVKDSG